MPKDRYRLYHVEKAKGGIALTMTAGSAVVSPDSPPVFGNLLAYKDEIVPWMRRLADDCHEHGAAVMIQLTHLGRRTAWNKADWLPVLAPSPIREPAHRAFPKAIEDWDIARIVADYAAAAAAHAGGRARWHRDRGLRPSARPVLVAGDQSSRRRLWRQRSTTACASRFEVLDAVRARGRPGLHRRHPHGRRRGLGRRPHARGGASRSPSG